MQWLAVILAAVAALAATAQSYLLWADRRDPDAERVHLQRVQYCEGAIGALDQAAQIAERYDESVQAAIERLKAQQQRIPESSRSSEEEIRRIAESSILTGYGFYFGGYNWAGARVYFSDAERSAIGYDEIARAFDNHLRDGSSNDELIARFAAAAEKRESVQNFCRPIMLGDVR